MPRKQPIGPVHGIRDQVWLGQATSGGRRKKTERCGITSRGKLPGPRSSADKSNVIRPSNILLSVAVFIGRAFIPNFPPTRNTEHETSQIGKIWPRRQFIDMQTLGKSFALFTFQKHVARRFFFTPVHFEFATSVCPDLMFLASRSAQEIERFSTSIKNRQSSGPATSS
uniref:Uncharacterized protein n=1 Tax=Caenorhabditis japonica TaxID=281687 RepID=A0A8R1I755_CAEJA